MANESDEDYVGVLTESPIADDAHSRKKLRKTRTQRTAFDAADMIKGPLMAVIALAVMFVIIPIFSDLSAVESTDGLVKMSETLAEFTPIYGIGLAIGMLVLFFSLSAYFRNRF